MMFLFLYEKKYIISLIINFYFHNALSLCIHELCDPSNPSHFIKLRFPSCTIFFPRGIYPDESHDTTRTRRTLQL